jgi:Secretion system C-terminal sorting domain
MFASSSFDSTNFSSYPNPVVDILNLSYSKNIDKVQVINLLGQEVVAKSINATDAKVDMSALSSGTYLVKVTSDNQIKTLKVIKQ